VTHLIAVVLFCVPGSRDLVVAWWLLHEVVCILGRRYLDFGIRQHILAAVLWKICCEPFDREKFYYEEIL
jgi:hypothetical protein